MATQTQTYNGWINKVSNPEQVSIPPSLSNNTPTSSYKPNGLINPIQKHVPLLSIIIKNLPLEITETEIRSLLNTVGTLTKLKLAKNGEEKFLGWCLCQYNTHEEVKRAYRLLHDFKVLNKNLILHLDARTDQNKTNEDKEFEEIYSTHKAEIDRLKRIQVNALMNGNTAEVDSKNKEIAEKLEAEMANLVTYADRMYHKNLVDYVAEFTENYNFKVEQKKKKLEEQKKRRLAIENEVNSINDGEIICTGDVNDIRTRNANLARRERDYELENRDLESRSDRATTDRRQDRSSERHYDYRDRRPAHRPRYERELQLRYPGNRRREREKFDSRKRDYGESFDRHERKESEFDRRRREAMEEEANRRKRRREYEDRLRSWENRERRKKVEWEREDQDLAAERKEIEVEAEKLYSFFRDYGTRLGKGAAIRAGYNCPSTKHSNT